MLAEHVTFWPAAVRFRASSASDARVLLDQRPASSVQESSFLQSVWGWTCYWFRIANEITATRVRFHQASVWQQFGLPHVKMRLNTARQAMSSNTAQHYQSIYYRTRNAPQSPTPFIFLEDGGAGRGETATKQVLLNPLGLSLVIVSSE